jgi:hypothetical protein
VVASYFLLRDSETDKTIRNVVKANEATKNNRVTSFEVIRKSDTDSFITVTYKAECIHAGTDGLFGNQQVEDSVILPKRDNGLYGIY